MKNLFIISISIALVLLQNILYAQATGYPYEDALKILNNLKNSTNKEEVYEIISFYSVTTMTPSLLAANPFLSVNLKNGKNISTEINALNTGGNIAHPTGGGNGILGANVTNFADGTAKFLIARGKEELSMAFFKTFKEELTKYPELKYLFPKSSEIILNIEAHNILTLLQELRDAFNKDLLNTPNNLLSLRNFSVVDCKASDAACNARVPVVTSAFTPSVGYDPRYFIVPINVMQGIIDGSNIVEIMNKVVSDPAICLNDDFNSYIKLTTILLDAMRSSETSKIFITQSQIKNLFDSPDLLRIFLGLVYEKYNTRPCYLSMTISGNTLRQIFENIITSRTIAYLAFSSLEKINISLNSINKQNSTGTKVDPALYGSLASSSFSVLSNISKTMFTIVQPGATNNLDSLYKNISIGTDLCIDIQQRNYAGIFNDVVRFFNTNNRILRDTKLKSDIIKYLSFAANIASANSSDEVREAINAVSLPPGSYSIKQKSRSNISLNAYIGYCLDIEKPYNDWKHTHIYSKGVYAPVGFSFSKGFHPGGAITLFASIIDVGSIASYRVQNSTTDTLKQEVRLESIISPSFQLMYAIPKTPIVVCTGWRLTPRMFYSKPSGFEMVNSKSVFNVSILIDIPIFTILNRPFD